MNKKNDTMTYRSVDWLAQRAGLSPNRIALIDASRGERITFADWNRRANRVVHALHALGLRHGDRVAVLSLNCLEYLDILFACQKSGIVLQTLNYRLAVEELAQLIEDVEPRVLIYTQTLSEQVAHLCKRVAVEHLIALGEPLHGGHLIWNDWVERASDAPPLATAVMMDDPWVLCYTGGTTGLPKAAILTHSTMTWNAINTVVSWDLRADDVTFLNMPLFHTGGINVFTVPLVHVGGCSVVCTGFDVDQVFDLVTHQGVNIFFAVPTMFIMMQQHPRWEQMDFSACRIVLSGGAPCPMPVFERFFAKGVAFKTGYGLTEAGPNNFWVPNEDAQRKAGAVGFPLFHVNVRIVDGDGNECGADEVGELLLRGPHVIPGYWNNPEATNRAIIDGWLHTGDLARRDHEGYISIVGRSKDMIISGGENIYPAEVESVMLGHPAVAEASLIGIPDSKWGEVGRAIVVVRTGMSLRADDLIAYMRPRLAGFKIPKSVIFVEKLPKTGASKIDKQALQQLYGG